VVRLRAVTSADSPLLPMMRLVSTPGPRPRWRDLRRNRPDRAHRHPALNACGSGRQTVRPRLRSQWRPTGGPATTRSRSASPRGRVCRPDARDAMSTGGTAGGPRRFRDGCAQMERSPLVCSVCDGYLTLDERVIVYRRPADDASSTVPRFVHPQCDGSATIGGPNLVRAGAFTLRAVVIQHLRERTGRPGRQE
jgi:hypothetical protein